MGDALLSFYLSLYLVILISLGVSRACLKLWDWYAILISRPSFQKVLEIFQFFFPGNKGVWMKSFYRGLNEILLHGSGWNPLTGVWMKSLYRCKGIWMKSWNHCTGVWMKSLYRCIGIWMKSWNPFTGVWIKSLYRGLDEIIVLESGKNSRIWRISRILTNPVQGSEKILEF